ncbi:MAG: Sec-independent protein translocase protein TatB [Casimicrobium sp.]|jgi:sec-independent protein translocase protein TatB
MLELSFGKMMIIAVVALIVLGPEKLPKVARTLGHLLGRARSYANQVKQDIDREMQMDELKKLQQAAQDAAKSFETTVNEAGRSVEHEAASASKAFNEMDSDYRAKLATAEAGLENTIAAPSHAGLHAPGSEIDALEKSIAEQALEAQAVIDARALTSAAPSNVPATPAPVVDADKKAAA